jgi:hypothetical protein
MQKTPDQLKETAAQLISDNDALAYGLIHDRDI